MSEPESPLLSDLAAALKSPLRETSVGTTQTDFRIFENVDDPSRSPNGGVPLHSHRTEDEGWYVIEGALRFRYGEREFDAPAGSGVLLQHGTPHTFWNPGPGPVRYLLIVRPQTARLLEVLHSGAEYPPNAREVFDRFDVDLLE
jgi:mannose-6-phosphate isomerase-like protein (cupin superfamily)